MGRAESEEVVASSAAIVEDEQRVFQMQGTEFYNRNDPFDKLLSEKDLSSLTVVQLKQQLRLRGLKLNGNKRELIQRIISFQKNSVDTSNDLDSSPTTTTTGAYPKEMTQPDIFAQRYGKEIVDVTEYVEVPEDIKDEDNAEEEGSEVWGAQAKLVNGLENPVVDNLLRTVIEFVGYDDEKVQAYICASRESLKSYMEGGSKGKSRLTPKEQVLERQRRREKAEREINAFKLEGEDDPDHSGFYYINDYSDVGLFTVTGAKVSASEVEGILLLCTEGFMKEDTVALCEKIAFECQPCVVMVPDVFQSDQEENISIGTKHNPSKQQRLIEERINLNIRASANVLREVYGVSSVVVFGLGLGGGRALEAAAGWSPTIISSSRIKMKQGKVLPPPVNPMACVAWYPSHYRAQELFGVTDDSEHAVTTLTPHKDYNHKVAIMVIFAGGDTHPGAQPSDAEELKKLFESSPFIKDYMVKVFPGQKYGFAHIGLASEAGPIGGHQDAEVASLLSTAWLEAYSRVFLPTVGSKVRDGNDEWGPSQIEMKNINDIPRLDPESINYDEEWFDFESLEDDYKDALNQVSW
jgi:dienelactone hydrolase